MRKMKKWISIAGISVILAAAPMTVWAGWEQTDGNYYYRQEDGSLAVNTTTPDGYLVGADRVWVAEKQEGGGYVRTPYDLEPYRYDSDWRRYIFDEDTDYAWVSDNHVLAAVRGITPVTDLSETSRLVYDEVCSFLNGFDYGASDYEKAKQVYEEITKRAVYHEGDYEQADDEVYSILVNGTGKCVGFARTFKLLANAVGLKSGFREDGAHMWNSVYIDGTALTIDTSTIGTSSDFYLGRVISSCPHCGTENRFGNRVKEQPCNGCGIQVMNPKYQ